MVGQIGGPTHAVAVQGTYAYIGVGVRLVVLDVSDPAALVEIGSTAPFPHFVEDVVVSGTLAYVAAGGAGLRVVDVSDPDHPTEVGAWDSTGYAEGVAVAGSTVYLADGPYGLRVVDVSDPAYPTEVGFAYPMNYAFEVAVARQFAYIAAAGAGLLVADVSNPAHPVEVGSLDTPGYAYGVAVAGNMVYVADGWEGLRVVNVVDPAHPVQIGSYETPGWAFDVVVSGTLAYVADAFKGLQVVDVSDLMHSEMVGSFEVSGGYFLSVAVAGSIAYVTDYYYGFRVVNVSDPTAPTQVDFYHPMGFADNVIVVGNYAYLAAGGYGMCVVDISDPSHPIQIGVYDAQSYVTSVALSENYAYLVTMYDARGVMFGLHIVDVSDPAHPTGVKYYKAIGAPRDIAVENDIAYIPDEWGFESIDVSDPFNPVHLGFIERDTTHGLINCTTGIVVNGTLAYGGSTHAGMDILDISNPTKLTLISTYKKGSFSHCLDVDVAGNRAYMIDGMDLRVIDVSNPANPVEMGYCDTSFDLLGVTVSGNTAYLACGDGGIAAVNVSDPYNPIFMGSFHTLGFSRQIAIVDDHVYVADGPNGLLILEMAAEGALPNNPGMGLTKSQPTGSTQESLYQAVSSQWSSVNQGSFQQPAPLDQQKAPWASAVVEISLQTTKATGEYPKVYGTCVVTSAADSGTGTLRWCMENAESGTTITFDTSVFPPNSPATIMLDSPLPNIQQGNITIDASDAGVILNGSGLTESPYGNGFHISSDGNTIMGLQILHFPGHGVVIEDCKNNVIGGDRAKGGGSVGQGNVISGNGGVGVVISGSSDDGVVISGINAINNTIIGNLIGTDVSGMSVLGTQGLGVQLWGYCSNNRIGGMDPKDRNIINAIDACLGAHSNMVIGNYIGTDITGTYALNYSVQGLGLGGYNNLIQGNLVSGGNPDSELSVGEWGGGFNVIIGNLIGTDASGTKIIQRSKRGSGMSVGGLFDRIGGTKPEEKNVICGKGLGIDISGAGGVGTMVLGNLIGTDISGNKPLGNVRGVCIGYGHKTIIGGTTSMERNVISGNDLIGIEVRSDYNCILGNYIGTDVSGSETMGNGGFGITIGFESGAEHNIIQGNLIAYTTFSEQDVGGVGIWVDSYPYNTIRRNSIYSNTGKGIVTSNGGNNMLTAPVITAITETSVSGTACPGCTVEVFSDTGDEGQFYEGSTVADASGAFALSKGSPLIGPNITATATDSDGNTSEFSTAKALAGPEPEPEPEAESEPEPEPEPSPAPKPEGMRVFSYASIILVITVGILLLWWVRRRT